MARNRRRPRGRHFRAPGAEDLHGAGADHEGARERRDPPALLDQQRPTPIAGERDRPLWESDAAGREAQADLDALARPRDQHPHHGDPPLLGLERAVRAGAADFEPCGWMTRTLNAGVGTVIRLGYPTTAKAAQVSPTR